MTTESRTTERVAILAQLRPDSYAAAAHTTDAVDMRHAKQVTFLLLCGDAAGATVTLKLQQSATTTAGDFADFSPSITITAITGGTGSVNHKQALINIREEDLADGKRYVRGVLTVADAAAEAAVVVLGDSLRYQPVDAFDLSTVAQIVTS